MKKTCLYFAALLTAGFLYSCNSDKYGDPLPYAQVNEVINLTNMDYIALRNPNGAVTIPGGVKGIIVARQAGNVYYAFERACPYQVYDSCAIVDIAPSRLFLEDVCCGTQFNFDGTVRSGPANRDLVRYNTNLSGNLLYITN